MICLTTGLEDPISLSHLISPIRVREDRIRKVGWLWVQEHTLHTNCMRGNFRASWINQLHCKGESRGPFTGSLPASKEGQNSSWAEQQQRRVDMEKLIQFEWLPWSGAAHCSLNRRTMAVLDQPQSCRIGRNRISFPSCFPANLNTRGRAVCVLSD